MTALEGSTAIITGAGHSIGRAVAHAMAGEGANLVLVDADEEMVASTMAGVLALGARAVGMRTNALSRDQVDAAVATAIREFGAVDILVNCVCGVVPRIPFDERTVEQKSPASTAVVGAFHFMEACFPLMKEHGGRIINIASGSERKGASGFAATGTLRRLSKVAARDWAEHRINVTLIDPFAGLADQREPEVARSDVPAKSLETLSPEREGTHDYIGRMAVLLSWWDSGITGKVVTADGGMNDL